MVFLAIPIRSLIASYIGNIVGALFVALPATWFYLGDYRAGGLETAEEGEGFANAVPEAQGSNTIGVVNEFDDASKRSH